MPPVVGRTARALDASGKARRSALDLVAVLAYHLLGQAMDPGFANYWWYQLAQTTATLAIVLVTTYADIFGAAGHFYDSFAPDDKMVHFWNGAAFAAGVDEALRRLAGRGSIVCPPTKRVLLAVGVSFAIAGVTTAAEESFGFSAAACGRSCDGMAVGSVVAFTLAYRGRPDHGASDQVPPSGNARR